MSHFWVKKFREHSAVGKINSNSEISRVISKKVMAQENSRVRDKDGVT